MWKRLLNPIQSIHIKAMNTLSEIKSDERGLSGVVVAILLILVAVLAVVVIWGFLSGYLEELWEQITSNTVS